jgi:predicted secreted protein
MKLPYRGSFLKKPVQFIAANFFAAFFISSSEGVFVKKYLLFGSVLSVLIIFFVTFESEQMKQTGVTRANFAPGFAQEIDVQSETEQISDQKSGEPSIIALTVGQEFSLELSTNPTTGFYWEIEPYNSKVLALEADKYTKDEAPNNFVGVGGIRALKFKALKPGNATVKLNYRRPWEKDAAPAETKILEFIITQDETRA